MPYSDGTAPVGRRPLDGVRIIDMTTVLMGPYATQILGDYGADVIKVEPPQGDIMRMAGPARSPGMGSMSLQVNRNKRSIVLDVKKPGGREAVIRLAATADVFVHNIRPAAMRRLDLGDDALRQRNPRLICLTLLGYGEGGPYAGRPAYDDLIQGAAGIASLVGGSGEPRYVPLTVADRIVGLNAVHAIMAALIGRGDAGTGQSIELSMFETMAQFVLVDHLGGRTFEPPLGPPGYSRLLAPDRRPYRTSDGHICVLVYNDKQWRSLFDAIGRTEEFLTHPWLRNHAGRAQHYPECYGMLADIMATRSTAEWLDLLQKNDIPCMPLHDLDSLIDDPHLAAVGFFTPMQHPTEGPIRLATGSARWSGIGPGIGRHPPRLGEHSVELLREAGFREAEIAELLRDGATVDGTCARSDAAAAPREPMAPREP